VLQQLGFNKIAEVLSRSSRTPLAQVQKHNRTVKRSGFCAACKRAKGDYAYKEAIRF